MGQHRHWITTPLPRARDDDRGRPSGPRHRKSIWDRSAAAAAPSTVMRGLVPRIHVFDAVPREGKTWMAGTKPGHDEARGAERLPDAEVVAHGQQEQEQQQQRQHELHHADHDDARRDRAPVKTGEHFGRLLGRNNARIRQCLGE